MSLNRRDFIKNTVAVGLLSPIAACDFIPGSKTVQNSATEVQLLKAANKPVLKINSISEPVIIESMELLKKGNNFFVRTRSTDGAVGISVTNKKADTLYPILLKLVFPFLIGKDARDLENLLDGVYTYKSNYKMQGLAFWCCVAWAEFSIIDLLGQVSGKHISELFGEKLRNKIPIYVASGNRGNTPEEEIEILQKKVDETGAKAIKFKVGGRMSRNMDSLTGRSENLIELSRKVFGDDFTIQADANGSYNVEKAIEIGKRLEGINAYLFEEPCPYDYVDETKQVADALNIPISGGEQEASEYRFRKMIANNTIQIVQPDLHYYGGFIRSTRVARMAEAVNKPITVHISNRNAGYAEMVNFSSYIPNIGRFQELKTGMEETADYFEPPIRVKDGFLNVPTAPGLGMANSSELIKNSKTIII